MAPPVVRVPCSICRPTGATEGMRAIPEEIAVAFTYDTGTYAVMMATPQDLEDFAIGFSVTERVVQTADGIEQLEIVESELGIELRMWLKAPEGAELSGRRRKIAGPTGCGLCGLESLAEAMRPPPEVGQGPAFTPDQVMTAMGSLAASQTLNQATRAVHGAALWEPARGPDHLVYMANQIGNFFKVQRADEVVPGIANHIKKFWDPRMRKAIFHAFRGSG